MAQLFKFDFSKNTSSAKKEVPDKKSVGTTRPTMSATSSLPKRPTVAPTRASGSVDKIEMSNELFNEYRQYIYKSCGIYFTDAKKYLLEGRIARRLAIDKIRTFEEYLRFLQSPSGRSRMNSLFEAITINETYFFRANQQFEALENIIIPETISLKSNSFSPVYKIWVAASSTGEEAYTIAIIILERLKNRYPKVQFQILASDINNAVLEQAKKGIYKEYAIRNVPPPILKKYFRFDGANYHLVEEVKKMVKFTNINLYDSQQVRAVKGIDVIFCCNVLIYFDTASKQQVVSHLYDSLNKNGYLFIGYSESLHGISKAFHLVHLPKAMAYKKL